MVARDVELRIVSALAKGFTPDVVARRLGQRASVAREVAALHGYPPAAVVRAWARAHDVECPAQGRIPAGVAEAYALAARDA